MLGGRQKDPVQELLGVDIVKFPFVFLVRGLLTGDIASRNRFRQPFVESALTLDFFLDLGHLTFSQVESL